MNKYRLGKKKKRAILEVATGREYLVFPQSNTEHVAEFLEWLNGKSFDEDNTVPDLSRCLSTEEKSKFLKDYGEICCRNTLKVFMSMGLKTHIEFHVINGDDKYRLLFEKVPRVPTSKE